MVKKTAPTIQCRFLGRIRQHIGCTNQRNFVEILMEVLSLEQGAVYKRLDSSTMLSINDIEKLCRHFHLSFDEIINVSGEYACFTYSALLYESPDAMGWVKQIVKDISLITRRKNPHIFYVSNEIPLFYHFMFPHLRAFHLYFWSRYIWKTPLGMQNKLNLLGFSQYLQTLVKDRQILSMYQSIPTNEILMPSFLDTTLRQIKYMAQLDAFTDIKQPFLLLDTLRELLQFMQNMTQTGKKQFDTAIEGASYKLYLNNIAHTSNIVLAATDEGDMLFTTLLSPDYLQTTRSTITNDMRKKINAIQEMSILLNKNERNYVIFFQILVVKIDDMAQELIELTEKE
jgi:hypothetical protein